MALSPFSKSPATCSSAPRSPLAERSFSQGSFGSTSQGISGGNPLKQLLQSDGFDSARGGAKAGGVEELAQALVKLAEVLSQSSKVLGGEGAPGLQGLSDLDTEVPQIDDSTPAPAAPRAQAAPPAAPQAAPLQGKAVAGPEGARPVGDAAKGGNSITLTNDGTTPMTVAFTPNAGEKAVDPVTLAPGQTQTVQLPENWSGNFRSTSGDGKAATLGEVKFGGGFGQTYYDVSYIEGHNASMTMQPEGGGRLSGTQENLLASAPDSIKAKGADGQAYGIKKTTTSNVQDPEVVDFFRKHVGSAEGYVIPTDDASTLGTSSKNLVVHMKNLA